MNSMSTEPASPTAAAPGVLWLIPTPLGEESDPLQCLPAQTLAIASSLDLFIAENARSARAFLKHLELQRPIQQIDIRELSEHTPDSELPALLAPVLAGRDAGLISEAGCPAVADPGAALVALAHRHGVSVRPMVGPSSILLALMASGLGGQAFSFAGYLPQQPDARERSALDCERRSASTGETVLIIETPYRNQALFETLIGKLSPDTLLMVAAALTLPTEAIRTRTVRQWRLQRAVLDKVPTVFGLLAPRERPGSSRGARRAR